MTGLDDCFELLPTACLEALPLFTAWFLCTVVFWPNSCAAVVSFATRKVVTDLAPAAVGMASARIAAAVRMDVRAFTWVSLSDLDRLMRPTGGRAMSAHPDTSTFELLRR